MEKIDLELKQIQLAREKIALEKDLTVMTLAVHPG